MNITVLSAAVALLSSLSAFAQTEVLKITLNDGQETTVPVGNIKEITFDVEEVDPAQAYAGVYSGTQTMTVGGTYVYNTEAKYALTAPGDGTLTVSIPEYSLSGTMMGDLTLGALTIEGLEYDEDKGGFYRNYEDAGLTQHFLAVNGSSTVFDNDYVLGSGSTILVTLDGNSIHVENPFKLGAMPLPLVGNLDGTK